MEKRNINSVTGILEQKGAIGFFPDVGAKCEYTKNKRTGKITSHPFGYTVVNEYDGNGLEIYSKANKEVRYKWWRRGNELLKIGGENDTVNYTIANSRIVRVVKPHMTTVYTYGIDGRVLTSTEGIPSEKVELTSFYFWNKGKLQRIETVQDGTPYLQVTYFDSLQFPYLRIDYKDATLKDTLFVIRYQYD